MKQFSICLTLHAKLRIAFQSSICAMQDEYSIKIILCLGFECEDLPQVQVKTLWYVWYFLPTHGTCLGRSYTCSSFKMSTFNLHSIDDSSGRISLLPTASIEDIPT